MDSAKICREVLGAPDGESNKKIRKYTLKPKDAEDISNSDITSHPRMKELTSKATYYVKISDYVAD